MLKFRQIGLEPFGLEFCCKWFWLTILIQVLLNAKRGFVFISVCLRIGYDLGYPQI